MEQLMSRIDQIAIEHAFMVLDNTAVSFLLEVKQEMIDSEDYESLIVFKQLEDMYEFPVPFMVSA